MSTADLHRLTRLRQDHPAWALLRLCEIAVCDRALLPTAPQRFVYEGSHAFLLAASFELFEQIGARQNMENLVHALRCGACPQVLAGSDWIHTIQEAGVYADEVTYTNIMSRYEEIVLPYTSGYREAPNATNIVLQDHCTNDFVEHAGIVNDPNAAWFVLKALDPDDPRPLNCVFVPPILGWSPDPTFGPVPETDAVAGRAGY